MVRNQPLAVKAFWEIASGHYITLAELFWMFARVNTCFCLYRYYTDLEVFIAKKCHSQSQVRPIRAGA